MSTSVPPVNGITLVGHLTTDPILRAIPNGQAVCDLRLAVNDQADKPMCVGRGDVRPRGEARAECLAAEDAIVGLNAAGLVHRIHEFVFPTRPAARFNQLEHAA